MLEDKEYYTLDEMVDEFIGLPGTKEREESNASIELALVGQSIREARKSINLTQKELGEKVGVQTAQISKIEKGRNITLATIIKLLHALGITADLKLAGQNPITLGSLCR